MTLHRRINGVLTTTNGYKDAEWDVVDMMRVKARLTSLGVHVYKLMIIHDSLLVEVADTDLDHVKDALEWARSNKAADRL